MAHETNDQYSLRGRVFNHIREDILSGKYEQNEELRENTIAQELNVSRTPVREALRQLELEGLVTIIPNKGAYVNGISEKDIHDIYVIRSYMEGLCARWACEKMTDSCLKELDEVVELTEFYIRKANTEQFPINISLWDDAHGTLGTCTFTAEVIPAVLPEQEIAVTQWFHPDCLAVYYGVEMYSDEHWAILAKHLDTYAKNGLNMIFTPVFTPALDTVPGGERPTCQLVDVYRKNGEWSFGFERLEKWVNLCLDLGIEYFEISHLFTQWGAKHAPKVMAHTENGYEKVFGWETDACGEEYPAFLKKFIPALIEKLEELGVADSSVFHISDEPGSDMLESYNAAKNTVQECLKGQIIMDALSDYSFFEKGVVEHPVVSTDHIDTYIENNVSDLWAYYCCCQVEGVSNRMVAMSTARNRIIGQQFYKYDIAGFLQWGFNFYFSQGSREFCDPYQCTDGGWWVPAGDTFSVYPAHGGGAYETIHLLGFTAALYDLRAFKLCEELYGKDAVMAVIEEAGEVTFKEYPRCDEQILSVREKINRMIAEKL